MKNILITGGAGTVGREIVKLLINNPEYHITCFDLNSTKNRSILRPFKSKMDLVYGDIRDKKTVNRLVENQDFIIHLAAIIPPKADQMPELTYQVNVLGTQNLLDAISASSKRPFLIYASSVSVYGDRVKNPYISVTDPLTPSDRDEYGKTKVEAERRIQGSNIDWSIFRLTAIMGSRNHKIGPLMFHMSLDTLMEIATPEDTARAFNNAIEKTEQLKHRIFNLSGGEKCRIKYRDFLEQSFHFAGLGLLDFPDKTFAEKNFHCGYFTDGDQLDEILQFRHDTIETFSIHFKEGVPFLQKFFTILFRRWIKRALLKRSDPYQAFIKKNEAEMRHFFGN